MSTDNVDGQHDEGQIEQLLNDLQSKDQTKQLQAIKFSGEQKVSQAVPALIKVLSNIFDPYEAQTRQLMENIIWALGEIADPQAIPILMDNLHNAFYKIQAQSIAALGKMRVKEAVAPLWRIIQNICVPEFVRLAAVETLAEIADQEAVTHLRELAESSQIPRPLQEKASQALHSIQGFW